MAGETNSWMLLGVTDGRQYQGNDGYADELQSVYHFDSDVGNCRRIAVGDFILLRWNRKIVGAGLVKRLQEAKKLKVRNLCPECSSTAVKRRSTKAPKWRCSACGAAFDEALVREETVDAFAAYYDGTFIAPKAPLDEQDFRPAWAQRSDQMSIRQLRTSELEVLLGNSWPAARELLLRTVALDGLEATESTIETIAAEGEFQPSPSDRRKMILRSIRERRGQQRFRRKLLRAFANRCLISDCGLVDLLEAAHIAPYRGEDDNHASNGLLLRADLHTLFDLNLLGIDPVHLTIKLHPKLAAHGYDEFDGKILNRTRARTISTAALEQRWMIFQEALQS